jgi:hypothetical protein
MIERIDAGGYQVMEESRSLNKGTDFTACGPGRFSPDGNSRMHHKVLIIDDDIGCLAHNFPFEESRNDETRSPL